MSPATYPSQQMLYQGWATQQGATDRHPYQQTIPGLQHGQPPLPVRPRPGLIYSTSHEVLVGKEGYPQPAPEREPKARFTSDEDNLLRFLKEHYNGPNGPKLSWKQIADFFPGRKSGTLQVRYCTKIRTKDPITWTAESVSAKGVGKWLGRSGILIKWLTLDHTQDTRLKIAVADYDREKWRHVATKLNIGASPEACSNRMETLDAIENQAREDQQEPCVLYE